MAAGVLAFVLLVSALAMFAGIAMTQRQQQMINDTRASLITVGNLRAAVGEAEIAVDEYILSSGIISDQPYQAARTRISSGMHSLLTLHEYNSTTRQDITQLQSLTPVALTGLDGVIVLGQAGQKTLAAERLSAGNVAQELRSLRNVIGRIQALESAALHSQLAAAADAQQLLIAISASTVILDIGAFIAILVVLKRTSALREQFAKERARAEAQAHIIALEETTQRMKEFLTIASHEIRTPLTSLKIALQLSSRAVRQVLSEAQEDAQQRGGAADATVVRLASLVAPLDRALASTDQLERLVADLVDATRIEASALEMRPSACDLGLIVEDCVEEQRLYHPGRTIALSRPDDAVIVMADGDRIRQVITNYLNNAYKFSDEQRPIFLSLGADKRDAMVSVRDEGPGIPPEEQSRIWNQFYRAPGIGHMSGSSEGFGLGLYICRTIIEQHGGKIGVESALGQGSTFWFTLPLIADPASRPAASK